VFTGGNIIGSTPENFATQTGVPTAQIDGTDPLALETVFAAVAKDPHTGVLSGVLADNGGAVQTVALNTSAANPARDSGDATLLVDANVGLDLNGNGISDTITTDARDLPRIDGAAPDLGAFEIQTVATPVMLDAVIGKQDLHDSQRDCRGEQHRVHLRWYQPGWHRDRWGRWKVELDRQPVGQRHPQLQ
jgi:hypothetical protein